jgi:hypothetical protein
MSVNADGEGGTLCAADGNKNTHGPFAGHNRDGLHSTVNYARHTLRLSISRHCLKRPRWVRLEVNANVGSSPKAWWDEWLDPFPKDFIPNRRNFAPRLYAD